MVLPTSIPLSISVMTESMSFPKGGLNADLLAVKGIFLGNYAYNDMVGQTVTLSLKQNISRPLLLKTPRGLELFFMNYKEITDSLTAYSLFFIFNLIKIRL